jgi:hypothetical protein
MFHQVLWRTSLLSVIGGQSSSRRNLSKKVSIKTSLLNHILLLHLLSIALSGLRINPKNALSSTPDSLLPFFFWGWWALKGFFFFWVVWFWRSGFLNFFFCLFSFSALPSFPVGLKGGRAALQGSRNDPWPSRAGPIVVERF